MKILEKCTQPRRRLYSLLFGLVCFYYIVDFWSDKQYLSEADLPRRLEQDIGHEKIEPISFNFSSTCNRNTKRYCKTLPSYGKLQIEENGFSCEQAARGEKQKSPNWKYSHESLEDDLELSCPDFIAKRKYLTDVPVDFELTFPIAYSIVAHKDPSQVERLIRSIYRTHNHYCIHIDLKSPQMFKILEKYASCFENIILIKDRVDVTYAHYTRLLADLKCMDVLLKRNQQWKYLINLCGQDFPLKTNYQMVKLLSAMYPRQSIPSSTLTPGEGKSSRIEHSYVPSSLIQSRPSYFLPEYKRLEHSWWYRSVLAKKRETLPIGKDAPLYAGSAYNIFSRDFVNWTVTSEIAREMINWSRDTYSPDEFIWATLYRSGIAPNSDPPGKAFDRKWRNTLPRMIKWKGGDKCSGQWQRDICINGHEDIGWLLERRHFFANKFSTDLATSNVAIQCLEKTLRKIEHLEACGYEDSELHQLLTMDDRTL